MTFLFSTDQATIADSTQSSCQAGHCCFACVIQTVLATVTKLHDLHSILLFCYFFSWQGCLIEWKGHLAGLEHAHDLEGGHLVSFHSELVSCIVWEFGICS